METRQIKLPNGGAFVPLDLSPWFNPANRIDPVTLPDLPAGISIVDLQHAHDDPDVSGEDKTALWGEICVRTIGYLPVYGPDGKDFFGYDRDGFDSEGRDRYGLTIEERAADPMMSDEDRLPTYAGTTEAPDQRAKNTGKFTNRGNKQGHAIVSTDGTRRLLNKCWHDVFIRNEVVPLQDRLTDEELTAKIQRMFLGAHLIRMSVRKMRWLFNNGKLQCQNGLGPLVVSYRYVKAAGWLYKTTTRGRKLESWDLTDVMLGQNVRPKGNDNAK